MSRIELARGGLLGAVDRRDRRPPDGAGAQSHGAAAGPACAVRHHRRAGGFRRGADVAGVGFSRGLSRRHHSRQPADPRAQFGGGVSRRRHLAGADRDVRSAGAAGVAAAPARQRRSLRGRGAGADAGGAAARGVAVPGAVPVQLARTDFHRLDRPARRGRDLSGVDPDAGRAVESLSVFRRRLCRGRDLAAAAGLDAGAGGAAGCTWRCRAPTARRAASNSTCRASSNSNWSAMRSGRKACTSAAACCRPGRSRRW